MRKQWDGCPLIRLAYMGLVAEDKSTKVSGIHTHLHNLHCIMSCTVPIDITANYVMYKERGRERETEQNNYSGIKNLIV